MIVFKYLAGVLVFAICLFTVGIFLIFSAVVIVPSFLFFLMIWITMLTEKRVKRDNLNQNEIFDKKIL